MRGNDVAFKGTLVVSRGNPLRTAPLRYTRKTVNVCAAGDIYRPAFISFLHVSRLKKGSTFQQMAE